MNPDADVSKLAELTRKTQLVKVPLSPCPRKEDYAEYCAHWPVTFHRTAHECTMANQPHWSSGVEYAEFPEEYRTMVEQAVEAVRPDECLLVKGNKRVKGIRAAHPLHHPVYMALKALGHSYGIGFVSLRDSAECSPDYIATGYTCILHDEPCLFCAMALLHSRIQRVFYTRRSVDGGFSKHRLHEHAKLNHHFSVFELAA